MITRISTERLVRELEEAWASLKARDDATRGSIEVFYEELNSARANVAELIREKRTASKAEKRMLREEIASARERAEEARRAISSAKQELREIQARQRETSSSARALSNVLRGDVASIAQVSARFGGAAFQQTLQPLQAMVTDAQAAISFEKFQLDRLSAVTHSDQRPELTFEYLDANWYELKAGGREERLQLAEPVHLDAYLTRDEATVVSSEALTVYDTLTKPGMSTEERSIAYADALLKEKGHAGVLAIGGPGLLDMTSLLDGKLWVTEVKGTQGATGLERSGLLREYRDGSKAWENSHQWLMRELAIGKSGVIATIEAIDKAIAGSQTDPVRASELEAMRHAYVEAARTGFSPLNCEKQVVQVGFQEQGDVLRPPEAIESSRLDGFIQETESKIVQINVISNPGQGSPAAEAVEETAPDVGVAGGQAAPDASADAAASSEGAAPGAA